MDTLPEHHPSVIHPGRQGEARKIRALLVLLLGIGPSVLMAQSSSDNWTGTCTMLDIDRDSASLEQRYRVNFQPLIVSGDAVFSCSCLPGRQLAGAVEQRALAGDTEQRSLAGAVEERQLAGDTEARQLAGATETRTLAGDTEQRQLAGATEARQLAGDTEQRQLAGATEARQLAGDTEARQLAGDTEARQLSGDTEARQLAGDTELRQLAGNVQALQCGTTSSCSGVAININGALSLYESFSLYPVANACID